LGSTYTFSLCEVIIKIKNAHNLIKSNAVIIFPCYMKKLGLKDIAKEVGVSTALVSYVLNNKEEEKRVGKEIAQKIRNTAKKLNYRPNQIAKSLKIRKTYTLGLIVASLNYRFTNGIISAIEAEARNNHYTVLLGSSDEDPEKFAELINVLVHRQVDGLILLPVENSEDHIEYLMKREVPFVLIDRIFPEIKTNWIALNNFKASYESIMHIIKTDHKRIGFINLKNSLYHLQERSRGYLQALKDNKFTVKTGWHREVRENNLKEDLQKVIGEMIKAPLNCDAIFFATEYLTIAGLKIINAMGIKVPKELAVMSFDESEAFELFYCPITHARQPLERMGKEAMKTLIEVMKDKKVCEQINLESDLIIRKSCGEN
jgi:LacI family transcriptional regulator